MIRQPFWFNNMDDYHVCTHKNCSGSCPEGLISEAEEIFVIYCSMPLLQIMLSWPKIDTLDSVLVYESIVLLIIIESFLLLLIMFYVNKLKLICDDEDRLIMLDNSLNYYNHQLMHKQVLIYHIGGFLDT